MNPLNPIPIQLSNGKGKGAREALKKTPKVRQKNVDKCLILVLTNINMFDVCYEHVLTSIF